MTGTIVNAVAIVAGSLLGLLIKKGLPKRVEETVLKVMGLSVAVIGINGIISSVFTVTEQGGLSSSGELLMFVSLAIGAIVGELLDIEGRLERVGEFVESKMKSEGFSKGFVTASILYCVGAMAVIGSLNDGISGDSSILFVKSSLDGISSIILTSTLGIGVLFSALPVFLYQGSISLLAGVLAPLISETLLSEICAVGYAIVVTIGLNFLGIPKIRAANLLPAIAVPILWHIIGTFM